MELTTNTASKIERVGQKVARVNRTRIAKQLGLDRSYVSQVLAGKRTPGLDVAAGIAKGVGVSLDGLHAWLTLQDINTDQNSVVR